MNEKMLTREGFNKIEAKLDYLKNVKRKEVADRLHAALEGGGDDLLENAELEAARNEQAFVEGQIDDLSDLLSNAKVVDEPAKAGEVQVGCTVTIQEEGEDPETYMIVGAAEADPAENKISHESPIGKAVMGHRKGQKVTVDAPAGAYKVKIVKIE